MLEHVDLKPAAKKLEESVAQAIAAGVRTRDVGGYASTSEMTDQVIRRLAT